MSIQDVADLLQVSKKKIWQAVKDGTLMAEKVQKGAAWRYHVDPQAVEAYRLIMDQPVGWETLPNRKEKERHGNATVGNDSNATETVGNGVVSAAPPVELYVEMLNRLQRAERRAIELELTLRQSQRLLSENAESITESGARVMEAEAKAQAIKDSKQQEIDRLAAELASTSAREAAIRESEIRAKAVEEAREEENTRLRSDLEAMREQLLEANQRSTGLLSWFGFRRKRTSSAQVDKAI